MGAKEAVRLAAEEGLTLVRSKKWASGFVAVNQKQEGKCLFACYLKPEYRSLAPDWALARRKPDSKVRNNQPPGTGYLSFFERGLLLPLCL